MPQYQVPKCRHCQNDDESMMEHMGLLKGERYFMCNVCTKVTGVKLHGKTSTDNTSGENTPEGNQENGSTRGNNDCY